MRTLLCLLVLSLVPLTAAEHGGDAPPAGERKGVDVGKIIELQPLRGGFVLKSDRGHTRAYMAPWRGGLPKDGGGLDPDVVERVRSFQVGDRVELLWEFDERFRVVKVRREGDKRPDKPGHEKPEHERPGHAKPEHGKPEWAGNPEPERHPLADQIEAAPAATQGWVKGVVQRSDPKGLLIVIDEAGQEHRFVPHWRGGMPADGGGFDREMVACVAKLQPGQKVGVRWEWEERPRVAEIATY